MASTTLSVIYFCLIAALSVVAENADPGGQTTLLDGVAVETSTTGINGSDADLFEAVGRVLESLPETDGDEGEGDAVENGNLTFINATYEFDAPSNTSDDSTGNSTGNGTNSNGGFTPGQIVATMWAISLSFVSFVILCCFFIYYAHQNNICNRLCPNRRGAGGEDIPSSPGEASPAVRMMRRLRQSIGRACDEVLINREVPPPHLIEEQRDDREQSQSVISDGNDGSKELSQSAISDFRNERQDSFVTCATNGGSETSEPMKDSVGGASELSLSNDTGTREPSPFDVETREPTETSIAGSTRLQQAVGAETGEQSQTHVAGTSKTCITSDAVHLEGHDSINSSANQPGSNEVCGATASHEDVESSPPNEPKPLKVFKI